MTAVISQRGTQVTVAVTRIEDVWNKKLEFWTSPSPTSNHGSNPQDTQMLDLQMIEHRWNIDGLIQTAVGNGDTNSAAKDKKTDLDNIFKKGGTMTMSLRGGSNKTINMEKLTMTDNPDDTEGNDPDILTVKFTALEGVGVLE